MPKKTSLTVGKLARSLSRLRGGGSALPGLLVETIDPHFLKHSLQKLPFGVVVISGTNGKTTTTKMVVDLLRSQDLKVFTNPTGSNFKRGIISAIIEKMSFKGKFDYDIAVLELDEAHGALFVKEIKPAYCLLLNVMRDQLDRFGEIDSTAAFLHKIAAQTTKSVVFNGDDPRLANLANNNKIDAIVHSFGTSQTLRAHFPSDDSLYGKPEVRANQTTNTTATLESIQNKKATITLNGQKISVALRITGMYNVLNATAALALTAVIMGDKVNQSKLIKSLESVTPAFGRGEIITIHGSTLELILVKNPSGFRLALSSYPSDEVDNMIVINDNYADGRDMSWLWDVDFTSLTSGVKVVSGSRADDMALRLQYDELSVDYTNTAIAVALKHFVKNSSRPKRIYCTYTAMLQIRNQLKKYVTLERAL